MYSPRSHPSEIRSIVLTSSVSAQFSKTDVLISPQAVSETPAAQQTAADLLLCIRKAIVSAVALDTNYSDWVFS
jgi:hypothetical protein